MLNAFKRLMPKMSISTAEGLRRVEEVEHSSGNCENSVGLKWTRQ